MIPELRKLDRRGMLLENRPQVGTGGAVVDTLTEVRPFYVGKVTLSARTIMTGEREAQDAESVFVCRWFREMKPGLWFDCEGQRYRITRCDELGRREGWRFYGKAIT